MLTVALLFAAGLVAGALNSIAGGGSFIAFPALLAAGVPPIAANASNTYAALPGYLSGFWGYWRSLGSARRLLVPYGVVAAVFGYVGAELLLHISDEAFRMAVPWLMLFAVTLFALGRQANAFFAKHAGDARHLRAAGLALIYLLLAALCVYGGFFNAGFGIMLLAFLALAGLTDIHAMNGLKLWISSTVAVAAVIRFALEGSIDWYHGSITLVGVTIGGYGAARLATRVPQSLIRGLVIVYGVGLTGWFFWTTYGAIPT